MGGEEQQRGAEEAVERDLVFCAVCCSHGMAFVCRTRRQGNQDDAEGVGVGRVGRHVRRTHRSVPQHVLHTVDADQVVVRLLYPSHHASPATDWNRDGAWTVRRLARPRRHLLRHRHVAHTDHITPTPYTPLPLSRNDRPVRKGRQRVHLLVYRHVARHRHDGCGAARRLGRGRTG